MPLLDLATEAACGTALPQKGSSLHLASSSFAEEKKRGIYRTALEVDRA